MKFAVTTLESFRLFRDYEFIDQQEMIDRINRVPVEPTDRMYLGSALHKILENPDEFRDGANFTVSPHLLAQGEFAPSHPFTFDGLAVHGALHQLPQGPVELRSELEIGGVTLRGIADLISGVTVYDHKVSTRAPKPDSYAESMQWRCYLEMFCAERFVYNHIQLSKNPDTGIYELVDVSRFEHFRYPAMTADIERVVADLVDFVKMIEVQEAA